MSGRAGYEGRVALVTGATGGLGLPICRALAAAGARVALLARGRDVGEDCAQTLRDAGADAAFFAADVTDETQVAEALAAVAERFGGLDVAVHVAGAVAEVPRPLHEIDAAEFRHLVDANLLGTWLCIKHEIPWLAERFGAAIVNVASMMGLVGADAGIAPYISAKHAVVGLTKAAALELAPRGIRVNAVCPAFVSSPILDQITGGAPEAMAQIAALHPLGRVAEADEVADAVLWLGSEQSSFVTGTAMPLDGGCTAR
ncbi:MAG: SDR family oxidoreductase [Acidobacteriota bacterium]